MGTDIFAFVEVEYAYVSGISTTCFAELSPRRDYDLFDMLFAVRHQPPDGAPAFARPPRGFPVRCSPLLAKRAAGWPIEQTTVDNEFGVSWLDASELRRFLDRYRTSGRDNAEFEAILAMMTALDGDGPARCRLVFWFSP